MASYLGVSASPRGRLTHPTPRSPRQAETPLLSPAINHFLLNSKKYYFSDRLGRRNQTSDHMIFVIADDSMLDVIDSEKSLKDYLKE
jgi:hypothetical protein